MTESRRFERDILGQELYKLASALQVRDVSILIGGGYGLLLRQRHLIEKDVRTLRRVPPARSTEDLDVFLTAELVTDAKRVAALRDTLVDLGYQGVAGALYYQFQREVEYMGQRRAVKVDLLAPLPENEEALKLLKYDTRRVRPRAVKNIHAHTSPEALTIGEHPLAVELDGEAGPVTVYVPHPFTYLILKLHAYRDRRQDTTNDYGRHHAFDLFRTLAMTTEPEWAEAQALADQYRNAIPVVEARRIAHDLFKSDVSSGSLALQEHALGAGYSIVDRDIEAFVQDLHKLLTAPPHMSDD